MTRRGRVLLVTGAASGLGWALSRLAHARGDFVVLADRDVAALEARRTELPPGRTECVVGDVTVEADRAAMLTAATRRFGGLDVLVNNAGVWCERREVTEEGVERTFATNVLGAFTLTNELLPMLLATPHARIVNVASKMARRPRLDDLEFATRGYSGVDAYAESKGANRLLTWELDRRLEGKRVYANAVHPGMVASEITRTDPSTGLLRRMSGPFFRIFGKSTREGADTALWVASSADCEMSRGNFYERRKIVRCKLRDEELERQLWEACDARVAAVDRATP